MWCEYLLDENPWLLAHPFSLIILIKDEFLVLCNLNSAEWFFFINYYSWFVSEMYAKNPE